MKRAIVVIGMLALAGCNPPQPLNFSVMSVQPSPTVVDADLRGITATPGSPTERTGNLPPAVAEITVKWKEATEEALARTALFNDDSHVSLEIKILKLDAPAVGFTFPTYTDARYTLVDRSSGAILYSAVISATGTTPMDFAFVGAVRARESINRSVQNNIAAFIAAIESSRVSSLRRRETS